MFDPQCWSLHLVADEFIGDVLALGGLVIDWLDFIVDVLILDESVSLEG